MIGAMLLIDERDNLVSPLSLWASFCFDPNTVIGINHNIFHTTGQSTLAAIKTHFKGGVLCLGLCLCTMSRLLGAL